MHSGILPHCPHAVHLLARKVYVPTPLISDADQSNNAACPSDPPGMGDSCSLAGAIGCRYTPFTCVGSFDVDYLRKCNCRGNSFVRTEHIVDCIPQCPFGTPPDPADDCFLGQRCRYDPVGCTCRSKVEFQTNCQFKDQLLDGTLEHDCVSTAIEECPPDPIVLSKYRLVPHLQHHRTNVQLRSFRLSSRIV
jgi:hypothetical protein